MDWLNLLLENSTTPVFTAFLLGLLTAVSPCPLATNIAAIGYISKNVENRKEVFIKGILYTLGRIGAYTILGVILILILEQGASAFGIQKYITKWGEFLVGPLLLLIGLYMLLGTKLKLPSFGFSGSGENVAGKGGWGAILLGILFALAFCPSSGILYFGMLIPMSVSQTGGWLLPVVYAIATALPVLLVAWVLAFSVSNLGNVYGKIQILQKWLNLFVGILFILVGIYYCVMIYL